MKINRKIKLWALFVAMMGCGVSGFAQDAAPAGALNGVLKDRLQAKEGLLGNILRNPDRAPAELRDEILALRESTAAIHDLWLTEFRPGTGATAEEIKAARDAFQEEYAEQIAANKELRRALMAELREGIRDVVDETEWSEEARALYAEYKASQEALAEAWRVIRAELGTDATREEIVAAKERFKEANAELIAQQKELAKQVRELIRENRNMPIVERDQLPVALQDLRGDMAVLRDQIRARRMQAREEMDGMTREELEQYRRGLLGELKELHDEIKERRRQVIDEVQGGLNGDHRPEG